MGRVWIGTSGWQYDHWSGVFYPDDLPRQHYLRHYAQRLDSLEINASFYHLPDRDTFARWAGQTPHPFLFSVKASRYITHMKKLRETEQSLENLLDAAKGLGRKLGPILFQLPPRWNKNVDRLHRFLQALPPDLRYAFEFRDTSWHDDDVLKVLKDHNAAFCIYDLNRVTSPKHITADFAYIRLHGPDDPYKGEYGPRGLAAWAGTIAAWKNHQDLDVYCYFDNDQNGYAPRDALRLRDMLAAAPAE